MQPGRHRGLTAKLLGAAEGGDQGILEGIRGVLRVAGRSKCHGPQAISMTPDQEREGIRVAGNVPREQVGVALERLAALDIEADGPAHWPRA